MPNLRSGGYANYFEPGTYLNSYSALYCLPDDSRLLSPIQKGPMFSIAGIAVFRTKEYSGTHPNYSFPVPMCIWFFRF